MKGLFCSLVIVLVISISIPIFGNGLFSTRLDGPKSLSDPGVSWLSGWIYRKSHVITNSTGAGASYTIPITVINGSGSDNGGTVYCNNISRSDFGDVRFTGSDGVTLWNYWMQSMSGGVDAVFWVRVADDVSGANVTMYIYYGNPNVLSSSNGTNTFVKFDDFDNSANIADGDQWNSTQEDGTWYQGSQLSVTVGNSGNKTGGGRNGILDLVASRPGPGGIIHVGGCSDVHYEASGKVAVDFDYYVNTMAVYDNYWVSWAFVLFGYSDGTYWQVRLKDVYNGGYEWRWADDLISSTQSVTVSSDRSTVLTGDALNTWYSKSLNSLDYSNANVTAVYFGVNSGADNSPGCGSVECFFDNMRIRKYVSPEPGNGVWGAEESTPSIQSVSRTPNDPNYLQTVSVSAVIVYSVSVDATLSYTLDGLNWRNVTMTSVGEVFNATIPALPWNTMVQYRIYANGTSGHWVESATYFYTVSDTIPPSVAFVALQGTSPYPLVPSLNIRQGEPFIVSANASDPGSGINYVMVSYQNNVTSQGEWTNTTMVYNATTGLWTSILPGQPSGATVMFFYKAWDNAGNAATSSTFIFFVQKLLPGDIDGNGQVDMGDVVITLDHFGQHYP